MAVRFQPQRAEIAVDRGQSVIEAAKLGKIVLPHKCGGHGTCGTCKVIIESKTELSPPTRVEYRHLTEERIAVGYRLACQCLLTGPASVTVPEEPFRRVVRELLEKEREERELHMAETGELGMPDSIDTDEEDCAAEPSPDDPTREIWGLY